MKHVSNKFFINSDNIPGNLRIEMRNTYLRLYEIINRLLDLENEGRLTEGHFQNAAREFSLFVKSQFTCYGWNISARNFRRILVRDYNAFAVERNPRLSDDFNNRMRNHFFPTVIADWSIWSSLGVPEHHGQYLRRSDLLVGGAYRDTIILFGTRQTSTLFWISVYALARNYMCNYSSIDFQTFARDIRREIEAWGLGRTLKLDVITSQIQEYVEGVLFGYCFWIDDDNEDVPRRQQTEQPYYAAEKMATPRMKKLKCLRGEIERMGIFTGTVSAEDSRLALFNYRYFYMNVLNLIRDFARLYVRDENFRPGENAYNNEIQHLVSEIVNLHNYFHPITPLQLDHLYNMMHVYLFGPVLGVYSGPILNLGELDLTDFDEQYARRQERNANAVYRNELEDALKAIRNSLEEAPNTGHHSNVAYSIPSISTGYVRRERRPKPSTSTTSSIDLSNSSYLPFTNSLSSILPRSPQSWPSASTTRQPSESEAMRKITFGPQATLYPFNNDDLPEMMEHCIPEIEETHNKHYPVGAKFIEEREKVNGRPILSARPETFNRLTRRVIVDDVDDTGFRSVLTSIWRQQHAEQERERERQDALVPSRLPQQRGRIRQQENQQPRGGKRDRSQQPDNPNQGKRRKR